ncbi:rfaE bifunctional protein, domain II [Pseudonocardia ammonioxydans]|uniref:RfaE bifunctional protein, domain II n=1 Tax=Pseudonocardia ammonioxydans TaxID=260086 RepID=A0A1I4XQG4_PSUAM|nr:PfkB family carbohydrate kinase [Pseudonocardia ammonioxydans]SFN28032.1 rfaE bifunctional protein, domain II [Pseudonocardia ammonioxydans]
MSAPLVVVGDALLDVDLDGTSTRDCPDAPGAPVVDLDDERARPGGAGLAALLAADLTAGRRPVVLLTALGTDPAAARLAGLLEDRVELHPLPLCGTTPVKTRLLDRGRPVARLDTGDGRAAHDAVDDRTADLLAGAHAILVADYGRGVAAHPGLRRLLAARPPGVPLVWDPHPRGPAPVPGAWLVTPNSAEVREATAHGLPDAAAVPDPAVPDPAVPDPAVPDPAVSDPAVSDPAAARAAELLRCRWDVHAVAVTRGSRGALLHTGRTSTLHPPPAVGTGGRPDTCGAGDMFAAAATVAVADGADLPGAVGAAVDTATRYIASGTRSRGAAPATGRDDPGKDDGFALADRVRRAGGRVVATGGCFDLLHPGHLALLRTARARGDVLVVCLNSDRSVTRLKGPTRPLTTATDRAALLDALSCVDAVVEFDEPDPCAVLDRLRPHVWVKGGDHDPDHMPETTVVRAYGGTVETVPRIPGHSTSRLAHGIGVPDTQEEMCS